MHLAYKVTTERANAIAATCQNQTQLGVILIDLVRQEWRSCPRKIQSRSLTTYMPAPGMGGRYPRRTVARPRRRSLHRRTRRPRRRHPIRRRHREPEPAVPLCRDPARARISAISQHREAFQEIAPPPSAVAEEDSVQLPERLRRRLSVAGPDRAGKLDERNSRKCVRQVGMQSDLDFTSRSLDTSGRDRLKETSRNLGSRAANPDQSGEMRSFKDTALQEAERSKAA